jgi:hypothetical protein
MKMPRFRTTPRLTRVKIPHPLAGDLNEAVAITKEGLEFAFGTSASIDVRPVKTNEESTGLVYPHHHAAQ